jgi:protein-S-isoprenylcysteine O-methyltransferase Ste14
MQFILAKRENLPVYKLEISYTQFLNSHAQSESLEFFKTMDYVYTFELILITLAFALGKFTPPSLAICIAVTSVGMCLLIWCAGHARPGRIEGGDISGPWRFLRHPESLARFLIVIGFLFLSRNQVLFVIGILFLGYFYRLQVRHGDLELQQWLGPIFSTYRALTPSFLPQFIATRIPTYSLRKQSVSFPWSIRRAIGRRAYWESSLLCTCALISMALMQYGDLGLLWQKSNALFFLGSLIWHYKRSRASLADMQKLVVQNQFKFGSH